MAVIVRGGADKYVPGVLHVSLFCTNEKGKCGKGTCSHDTLSSTPETTVVGENGPSPPAFWPPNVHASIFFFLSIQVKYFYSEVLSP